jgi:hypothetical protein
MLQALLAGDGTLLRKRLSVVGRIGGLGTVALIVVAV